jgi:hypothetical protein
MEVRLVGVPSAGVEPKVDIECDRSSVVGERYP